MNNQKRLLTCQRCGIKYMKNTASYYATDRFCSRSCSVRKAKAVLHPKTKKKDTRGGRKVLETWIREMNEASHSDAPPPSPQKPTKPAKKIVNYTLPAISSGTYDNIKRGTYKCSKGDMYFRSKWEANYALYLDFLVKTVKSIASWEYEEDTFVFEKINFGTRQYTPDFKVFLHDGTFEYHEIKGYLDRKSKTKLKRMNIYFPQVNVTLIDGKTYKNILSKFRPLIKWY